jgi:hypothetical protein
MVRGEEQRDPRYVLTGSGFGGALTGSVWGVAGRTGAGRSVSRIGFPMSPI